MKIDFDKIIFDDSDDVKLLADVIIEYIVRHPEDENYEKLRHFCCLLFQVELELRITLPEADSIGG